LLVNDDDGSRLELYDMEAASDEQNNAEQNNVAATLDEVAKRLSEKLLSWRRSLPELWARWKRGARHAGRALQ